MKLAYVLGIVLSLAILALLLACTMAIKPQTETTAKILARRLGYHGMQNWPEQFATLGKISHSACEVLEHKHKAIQEAFLAIAQAVLKDVKDRILMDELADLTQLMGITLDVNLTIVSLSTQQEKILEIVVCSFAEGVKKGG